MLEQAIADLAAAVRENTAHLVRVLAGAGSAPAAKPVAAAAAPAAAAPVDLQAKIVEVATAYMTAGDDAQREKSRTMMTALVKHFGVPKASQVPADKQAGFLEALTSLSEGRTPEILANAAPAENSLI